MPISYKRPCPFCSEGATYIDYKDEENLRKFLTPFGKISSRRRTGACGKHQRDLAQAIKKARIMGLLPFIQE